ncbi:hypothetical protein BH11ARM1_BH11ARM1_06880 [soil metagenome]
MGELDRYDVAWDSPSVDSAGSMPIGTGQVVLNTWVEAATGDLLFYIGRTDSLSEISRILKLGRVRIHLAPEALKVGSFRQLLHLRNGSIEFRSSAAVLNLFVDSESNAIYVTGQTSNPVMATVNFECWRNEARELPKDEGASAWSAQNAPVPLIESADHFVSGADKVTWYHRNETSIVPTIWENQSLTNLAGRYDPLIHRTFGGELEGKGMVLEGPRALITSQPMKNFEFKITTHTAQTPTVADWQKGLDQEAAKSTAGEAERRTIKWWNDFWERSWVFTDAKPGRTQVPANDFPLRKAADSDGGNKFSGTIADWRVFTNPSSPNTLAEVLTSAPANAEEQPNFERGFTLAASITPQELRPGRIFDKLTAGGTDGFLFDTYPGDSLRLIVGDMTLQAGHVLKANVRQDVAASFDTATGEATLFLDGRVVARRPAKVDSGVTQAYVLQRYAQAFQGRGEYPIKFNGGYFTVEPTPTGRPFNADWRNWGDAHWYQNVRFTVHPDLANGDFDLMESFFKLYENARPLAESRTKFYHGAEGAYFPETMTPFGTYSGNDYGWDRKDKKPSEVDSPWWRYAWNQGPELVNLMLDRWDYTQDSDFLKKRTLPMAVSVLKYFDTRFKKDKDGRIILDPTQVVETYWSGVVNDMPSTAGLIAVTNRLCKLPAGTLTTEQKAFFEHMKAASPELPLEMNDGKRELAPAQQYKPEISNVENGELYAVWPFGLVDLAHPELLAEAKHAYATRRNHLDVGWGYDGNIAAMLGDTQEAARILLRKSANSNPLYRWPASWGPNFDWLPDQNHGGNLLLTTNLMLLQAEPTELGGAIRILPAWPKDWDVSFKLHAPGKTTVTCVAKAGKIVSLEVSPESRRKDIVWPEGWVKP